jgi:hypothetical protein
MRGLGSDLLRDDRGLLSMPSRAAPVSPAASISALTGLVRPAEQSDRSARVSGSRLRGSTRSFAAIMLWIS